MTEEQKQRKAERDKKYRENKKLKAERAAIHPAPETAFQISEEQMEKYRQELQPPVVIPEEPLTPFEVLRRRMEREARR